MGSGLDFDAGQEKALLARLMAMYGVVTCVGLIARFERVRRQEAMERELGLHRERIELSQAIHDTTAQTAYMIGLGHTPGPDARRTSRRRELPVGQSTYCLHDVAGHTAPQTQRVHDEYMRRGHR